MSCSGNTEAEQGDNDVQGDHMQLVPNHQKFVVNYLYFLQDPIYFITLMMSAVRGGLIWY